ncbi:MAG: Dyp-type peroxidase [Ginsengibacter sp.]
MELELKDIQGYIVRGYKYMMYSRYVMLNVTEPALAKKFLKNNVADITSVTHHPTTHCLNFAFTSPGLKALGLAQENLDNFTREFREGMATEHRQRLLGDFESSAPVNWRWGGSNNEEVHILLMVFGANKEIALNYADQLKQQYISSGLKEVFSLDGQTLPYNKEHFGFRDGISQPTIQGSGREGPPEHNINAGEFIMGYKNEYNVYPDTPVLATLQGETTLLPFDASGSGKRDLGRNGTYMVMRQLQEDVDTYWSFINDQTKNEDGTVNVDASNKLAAQMVGRWPSGAPIVKYPDADPGGLSDDDNFFYTDHDADGLKCPFGSHLRRTNPRDNFEDNGVKESIRLTRRHRIIRRARLYGDPYEGSPLNHSPNGEVGLMFTCFNTDISRQFEFIQYTWANYPKFKQLYNDPDPICGVKENPLPGTEQNFTIPGKPVNKYVTGLKKVVFTKGGAYFFFPSITAINYLSTI